MTQLTFNFGGREHTVEEKDAANLLRNLARVQHCRLGITEEMILDSETQRQYDLFLDRQQIIEQRDPGDENDYDERQAQRLNDAADNFKTKIHTEKKWWNSRASLPNGPYEDGEPTSQQD